MSVSNKNPANGFLSVTFAASAPCRASYVRIYDQHHTPDCTQSGHRISKDPVKSDLQVRKVNHNTVSKPDDSCDLCEAVY